MTGGGRIRRNTRKTGRKGSYGESPSSERPTDNINQKKLSDIIHGNLDADISRAKRKSEETVLSKFISKVGKSALIGIIVGALSAIPVIGPFIVPAYTAYKLGMAGKRIVDAYNNAKDNKEQAAITAGEKEVVKYVAGEITGTAVAQSASLVADGVKTMAQTSGVIDEVAKSTNVPSEILAEMLKGSVEQGIKKGASEFAAFIVEGGK